MMRYSVSSKERETAIIDPHEGTWWLKQNITAFTGLCQVRADRTEQFGGKASRHYRSKILLNPTWRQLYFVAKKQQETTKDLHHDFFEGYTDTGKDDMMIHPNHLPVRIIKLCLGS